MSWVMPAYLLIMPLFTLTIVLFCRIHYMVTFPKTLGETSDIFFFSSRKKIRSFMFCGSNRTQKFALSASKQPEAPLPRMAAWTTGGKLMKYPNLSKMSLFLVLLNGHTCQRPSWQVRKSLIRKKATTCRAFLVIISSTQCSTVGGSMCDHGFKSQLCH